MIPCGKCGTKNQEQASYCSGCGADLTGIPRVTEGDATGGVIPYKNPKALVAYYLGIFSGFPLIGLPLGIAAFVLGILGLKDRKKNPVIKGSVHAGIGIGCGCFFSLVWTVVLVIAIMGATGNL